MPDRDPTYTITENKRAEDDCFSKKHYMKFQFSLDFPHKVITNSNIPTYDQIGSPFEDIGHLGGLDDAA